MHPATTTHHAPDAPQDPPATATLINLPEDVENSILCFLALQDLANARPVHRKLAGWRYGPNVTEIQLPSKYIPPSTLLGYYTPDHVIGFNATRYNCIIDAGFIAVARGCPHLQSVSLFDCGNITDVGVAEVARKYPLLQSLKLWNCTKITDVGVTEVARGCPHLQTLNLGGCDKITDIGAAEVARGCPRLQTLHLGKKITDTGVAEVARACPHLQSLDLDECDNITDAGVMAVARGCPHLQKFDIVWCMDPCVLQLEHVTIKLRI